jgi:hypothetical protein
MIDSRKDLRSMNSVSREALEEMWDGVTGEDEKLDILFRITLDNVLGIEQLKKRKRFDTAVSGVTGIIGGVIAVVTKWFFFRSP